MPCSRGSPQVALVDELAHTNVPGLAQREALAGRRGAARGRVSTSSRPLNVQHLESLNDVVEQITCVKQRETIPDEVVRRADELQLVDHHPRALRNRLARGDVYPPERIDAALANYFRPATSSALRELALALARRPRRRGPRRVPRRHGIEQPWETRERVARRPHRSPATASAWSVGRPHRAALEGRARRACTSSPQDGLAAAVRGAARPAARARGRARRHVPRSRRRRRRARRCSRPPARSTRPRSSWARRRRSRWQRAHARLGDRQGDPRVRRRDRRPRHQPSRGVARRAHSSSRARVALSRSRARRQALGFVARRCRPPAPDSSCSPSSVSSSSSERDASSSYFSSSPSPRSAASGPALAAAVGGFAARQLVLHRRRSTRSRSPTPRTCSRSSSSSPSPRIVSGSSRSPLGEPPKALGARAEAEALSRARRHVLDRLAPLLDRPAAASFGLEGAAVLHRSDGGWRIEAASGERDPRESRGQLARPSSSTSEHVLALVGSTRPQRRPARPRRLRQELAGVRRSSASSRPRPKRQAASQRPTSCAPRSSPRSPTTCARRSPPIKASVTSLLQRRRRLDARGAPGVPRDDRRGDRPAQRARRQPARHEPAPDRRPRDQSPTPVGLDEVVAARARTASATATAPVGVECPRRSRACSPTPALLERALANVIANALASRRPDTPSAVERRACVDGVRRRAGRRPRARASPLPSATALPAVPAARRLRRSGEGVGLGLAVAQGLRRGHGRRDRDRGHARRRAHRSVARA